MSIGFYIPEFMMYQARTKKQAVIELSKNGSQYSNIAVKINKFCFDSRQGVHPREFCRRWFGLSSINEYNRPRLTESEILAIESEHGYREKCINLLARILQIKSNTIHRWGKGVDFDKIPVNKLQKYEIYLGYADAIRVMTTSFVEELDGDSLAKLLRQLKVRCLI